jgi:hypothetical protein
MYRAQYVELPFGRIFRDTATLSNADRLAAEDLELGYDDQTLFLTTIPISLSLRPRAYRNYS